MRIGFRIVCSLVLACGSGLPLVAQCTHAWAGGFGCPGTNAWVADSVRWDPDGPGPGSAVVVMGGNFTLAGDVECTGVVVWEPVSGAFAALPAPPLPSVQCVAAASNGDLFAVVAGYVGSAQVWQVVRYGAAGWTPLGNAFALAIHDLHVRPNGEVVVAGMLDPFGGGASLGAAARWNGTAWVSLGVAGWGRSLADLANGDLAVASSDTVGVTAFHAWNGTALLPFAGNGPLWVSSIVVAPTGALFAGASDGLWSWNGTAWAQHVPPPATGLTVATQDRIACTAGGEVLLACAHNSQYADTVVAFSPASSTWNVLTGTFANVLNFAFLDVPGAGPGSGPLVFGSFAEVDGRSLTNVARWNGSSWQALHDGPPAMWQAECMELLVGDRIALGGTFASCGTIATANVAEWTGSTWTPMGQGLNGRVRDLQRLPDGDLLAGGDFTASGAVAANRLARWNGSTWSQFANGVTGTPGQTHVSSIATMPNGDVIVAGSFTAAGGVPAANIARWNGTSWSPLGAGLAGPVQRIAAAPNGDLCVVHGFGQTQVQRWNGATWSILAGPYGPYDVYTLTALADGTIVVGGYRNLLTGSFGFVQGFDPVFGAWFATADDAVTEIVEAPDGDLLVFGWFWQIGGLQSPFMARMRRGPIPTWTAGVQSFGVRDAMFTPRGELLAQVEFGWGGMHSIGRLVSTCPASANAVGSGCTGSGGANLLAATCLPWIGGTFRADATGLAANGLALGVYGFGAASVPLAAIVPQGVAGCTLLAAPDVLDAHVPVAGAVGTQLAIPNVPALVGQTLFRQFVSLEIAAGAITALTSTNALAVTFGVF